MYNTPCDRQALRRNRDTGSLHGQYLHVHQALAARRDVLYGIVIAYLELTDKPNLLPRLTLNLAYYG